MIDRLRRLVEDEGFLKYFKNTSWLFAEKILRMVVGLFVGVWVARYLGPDRYGLLSYAQSFVGLFAAIAALGLDGILVRELVKYPEKENELLGTAFVLKLTGAILTLIILAIAVGFTSNDRYADILIFIIASSTIFQAFNIIDIYFQAKVLSRYIVFANVIALFSSSIIKVVLILNQASLIGFAWVVVFDGFIYAGGYVYFFFKYSSFDIKKMRVKRETAISLLRDSWPLILSGFVVGIYMKIDQVMIKEMIDSEAVGQYAAAVRISEAWYFIPMVVASSIFPAIINAKKISEELYHERLQKLYDVMVWMAVAIALPMSFLSDRIVNLLYGDQYNLSGGVLSIHIWAGVFVFLGVASSKWFITENLQRYSFYRTLAGAIVNIGANYILIPIYGIYGAAFSTLFAQSVASYLFNFTKERLRYTFLLQTNSILLPLRGLGLKFG